MDLNFNTKNLTGFAKWLAGAVGTFFMLWQVPQSHDAIVSLLNAYPHGAQIIGFIGPLVVIWGILHNPVKVQSQVKP